MEPVEQVLKSIYQRTASTIEKTYGGNISTIKGSREAASEEPTVLHIRFSSDVTTVFHTCVYGRFIEIPNKLSRKKLHRTNYSSNVLGGSFSNRDNAI